MYLNNLQALRYFEVVARLQHFTQAAQELYVSQPTLSKAIDALEQEIGVPLFEKQGRNVQLTKYGSILLDYVQQGFRQIDEGINQIQSIADSETGNICIASLFTMGAQFFPKIIKEFTELHPKITIQYYQKATSAILEQLSRGEIDLGFTGELPKGNEYDFLRREIVLTEELCLIVPPDHRLASRKSVSFHEILDETFIGWNEDTGIKRSINDTLQRAGISQKLNYRFYATEDNSIVGMVREGLGIALISTIPTIYTEGVVKIQISQPLFQRHLYMVWNKERFMSPAANSLRKYILSQ